MSVYAGPEVTDNGLVLSYDMGNTDKSWKGAPATNYSTYSSTLANFAYSNITLVTDYLPDNSYGTCAINTFDNVPAGARCFVEPTANLNGLYTGSIWAKSVPGSTATTITLNVKDIYSDTTRGTSGAITLTSNWQRISATGTTAGATQGLRFELNSNTSDKIKFWGTQIEQLSFASPLIPTTTAAASRSTTQALLDPIGKNTITATSLTYASNNTFSFNGTSGYLDLGISRPSPITTPTTYEVWFKNNGTTDSARGLIGSSDYALNGFSVGFRSGVAAQQVTMIYCGAGVANEFIFAYGDYTTSVSHGVFIFDGRTTTVYKNGVLIGSSTAAFDAVVKAETIRVGNIRQGGWSNLQADIYKVNVYNRALSSDEVKQNFIALRGRFGI